MWGMIDNEIRKKAKNLVCAAGNVSDVNIEKYYNIDTMNYSWVSDFIRDKTIRQEIAGLEADIPKIRALPIHKDELRKSFEKELSRINSMLVQQIQDRLLLVQQRQAGIMSIDNILSMKLIYPVFLAESKIDGIFSCLPLGVKKSEIDKKVAQAQDKINALKSKIDAELSPKHRWVYEPSGDPIPYPMGCRWTMFVEDWKYIQSRFNGNVNINGRELESEAERTAYFALGLDKTYKIDTRDPIRRPQN